MCTLPTNPSTINGRSRKGAGYEKQQHLWLRTNYIDTRKNSVAHPVPSRFAMSSCRGGKKCMGVKHPLYCAYLPMTAHAGATGSSQGAAVRGSG